MSLDPEKKLSPDNYEKALIEHELRNQKHYLRGLIEASVDGLVAVTKDGLISDLNREMARLVGYSEKELLGTPLAKYFQDPEKVRIQIETAFQEGSVKDSVLMLIDQVQKKKEVSFNASVYEDPSRNVVGILVSLHDISERFLLESTLKEKNRSLELASETKDRFLSMISHELRTPLTAILGFTSILLSKTPGPLSAEQEKQISIVKTSGDRLLSLINDLLDTARVQSGKIKLILEQLDIKALITAISQELKPLVDKKALKLDLVLPAEPLFFYTDKKALTQIITNLVHNAIKFTDKGLVSISCSKEEDHLSIEVRDTGIGIKPEDLHSLFEAFSQIEKANAGKGTGLGLYISQKLAYLLKGHITCTSSYGKGSLFSLTLPPL